MLNSLQLNLQLKYARISDSTFGVRPKISITSKSTHVLIEPVWLPKLIVTYLQTYMQLDNVGLGYRGVVCRRYLWFLTYFITHWLLGCFAARSRHF